MLKEFELRLELDEINLILGALAERPYSQVYKLIAKIQAQAQEQLEASSENNQADKTSDKGE